MIQLIKNVFNEFDSNLIEKKILLSDFPWYYKPNFQLDINTNNTSLSDYGFVHVVYRDGISDSFMKNYCDTTLNQMLKDTDITVNEILRVKINLSTYTGENTIQTPHVDLRHSIQKESYYTAIYYVNDSDGDTTIYNLKDTFTDEEDHKQILNKDLDILQSIPHKKNTGVVFDGNYFHSGNFPLKHKNRININFNFR
jgi:hypothetical protein